MVQLIKNHADKTGHSPRSEQLTEVFRAELLKRYSNEWDMETVSNAAHACAEVVMPVLLSERREAQKEILTRLKESSSGTIYQDSYEYKDGYKQLGGQRYEVVLTEAIDILVAELTQEENNGK